jgi:hypothetical protein
MDANSWDVLCMWLLMQMLDIFVCNWILGTNFNSKKVHGTDDLFIFVSFL